MINWVELVGYAASVLVAASLLMTRFLALRLVNLVGALCFVAYGLLIGSAPIVATNGFITLIDLYFLLRMLSPATNGVEYRSLPERSRERVDEFVVRHGPDIDRFFPDFSTARIDETYQVGGAPYVAMRDLAIVGCALVHPVPTGPSPSNHELGIVYDYIRVQLYPERSAILALDYVTRRYRGLGLNHRLYARIEADLTEVDYLLVPVRTNARRHRKFLVANGYEQLRRIGRYVVYSKMLPRAS